MRERFEHVNGDIYDGDFRHGAAHGKGAWGLSYTPAGVKSCAVMGGWRLVFQQNAHHFIPQAKREFPLHVFTVNYVYVSRQLHISRCKHVYILSILNIYIYIYICAYVYII